MKLPKNAIDLKHQRFNKLIALEFNNSKGGNAYWLCQCDCGSKKVIQASKLKSSRTVSCGCTKAERHLKYQIASAETKARNKCVRFMYHQLHKLTYNKGLKRTKEILGYDKEELFKHLESRFDEKMNWANYGSYWHIDHIIPVSYFLKNDIFDPRVINALNNLQPLEAKANLKKGANLPW